MIRITFGVHQLEVLATQETDLHRVQSQSMQADHSTTKGGHPAYSTAVNDYSLNKDSAVLTGLDSSSQPHVIEVAYFRVHVDTVMGN